MIQIVLLVDIALYINRVKIMRFLAYQDLFRQKYLKLIHLQLIKALQKILRHTMFLQQIIHLLARIHPQHVLSVHTVNVSSAGRDHAKMEPLFKETIALRNNPVNNGL